MTYQPLALPHDYRHANGIIPYVRTARKAVTSCLFCAPAEPVVPRYYDAMAVATAELSRGCSRATAIRPEIGIALMAAARQGAGSAPVHHGRVRTPPRSAKDLARPPRGPRQRCA